MAITAEQVEEKWGAKNSTKVISQIKATETDLLDEYFLPNSEPKMGNTVTIKIEKGAGLILASVAPNAEHLVVDRPTVYELNITLPRFPLENDIDSSTLNEVNSLDEKEQPVQLAAEIGKIQKEHKLNIDTTLEYMSTGAFFGKIMDGAGNILFDFQSALPAIEFKTGKDLIVSINEIDDAMVAELGENPGWDAKCSRAFMTKVASLAKAENLFTDKQAEWAGEGKDRALIVHGARFEPYVKSYKDIEGNTKDFIETGFMAAIPKSKRIYKFYYGRANHTQAATSRPSLYFSTTEKLPKGRGIAVLSETKAIPVCVNPSAIIRGTQA